MTVKSYLLSLPERLIRSTVGLGAGVAREVGEVALPDGIRHSQLYRNLVDATLQYLIEQVGGVEGVYRNDAALPDNFLARRTAGNAVEVLGIVALSASPVWILAALADVCGMGRHLIPEVTDAGSGPAAVTGAFRFAALSAGGVRTCGVTSMGSVYCWGAINDFTSGDGRTHNSATPVAVLHK